MAFRSFSSFSFTIILNSLLLYNGILLVYMEGYVVISKNNVLLYSGYNTIIQSGIQLMVKIMNGNTTGSFKWMGIGTGSTAPSSTQTALVDQISIEETTNTVGTTAFSDDTAIFQGTFTFTTTYTLREAGLFSSSASGVMLARRLFPAVNVINGDNLSLIWSIRL